MTARLDLKPGDVVASVIEVVEVMDGFVKAKRVSHTGTRFLEIRVRNEDVVMPLRDKLDRLRVLLKTLEDDMRVMGTCETPGTQPYGFYDGRENAYRHVVGLIEEMLS